MYCFTGGHFCDGHYSLRTQLSEFFVLDYDQGQYGWRSGKSACLPPIRVCFRFSPCSEDFCPGTPIFSPPFKFSSLAPLKRVSDRLN